MPKEPIRFTRNALTVECFFNEQGRIAKKIESYGWQRTEHVYQYDEKNRLIVARRDNSPTEIYYYNDAGQRIAQKRVGLNGQGNGTDGLLRYDSCGRLTSAGETSFAHDANGALAERHDRRGVTKYIYGRDTLLDKVILPQGIEIRYEYDATHRIVPSKRFKNSVRTQTGFCPARTRGAAGGTAPPVGFFDRGICMAEPAPAFQIQGSLHSP